MRILVVSDTHRRNENYMELLERLRPLDMVIHCGDVEGSEYALSQAADCPVQMVMGNNDFFSPLPRELEFWVGKYKVWVVHGHQYHVSSGNKTLCQAAQSRGAHVVLYGHTHQPRIDHSEEGVIAVNPGSLSYPRQDGRKPSYVLMEIDRHEEVHFTIAYL